MAFGLVKDGLLQAKRWPFAMWLVLLPFAEPLLKVFQ